MPFLQLIRYKNLIVIALLQYLLRYQLILPLLKYFGIFPVLSDFIFAMLVLATVLMAASGNVINDYFDVKIDKINRPDKVVVDVFFKRRTVMFIHAIMSLFAVILGLTVSIIYRKETYIIMFLVIPMLLWIYSTRLKHTFLIGNLLISFLTALVPYLVVSIEFVALSSEYGIAITETEACSTAWFWTTGFAVFAFVCNLAREIIKDVEDLRGDKLNGCRTMPVEMGIKYTKIVVVILTLLIIVILWTLFFVVPELRTSTVTLFYFIVLLTFPNLYLIYRLIKSKSKKDFHFVSMISKLIMVSGIFYIFVAKLFFV